MKKSYGIVIGVVAIVLIIVGLFGSSYNKMVKENENVESKYSDISVQLKRRTDLIPNLVNTV